VLTARTPITLPRAPWRLQEIPHATTIRRVDNIFGAEGGPDFGSPSPKLPESKVGLSALQRILRERSLRLANLTMAMILWNRHLYSNRASEDFASGND
jgi:hypothetical protein